MTDDQDTKFNKTIAENYNRLSRVLERYRRQRDGRAPAYSEREREFAKNLVPPLVTATLQTTSATVYALCYEVKRRTFVLFT